jgi:hypothetical protein
VVPEVVVNYSNSVIAYEQAHGINMEDNGILLWLAHEISDLISSEADHAHIHKQLEHVEAILRASGSIFLEQFFNTLFNGYSNVIFAVLTSPTRRTLELPVAFIADSTSVTARPTIKQGAVKLTAEEKAIMDLKAEGGRFSELEAFRKDWRLHPATRPEQGQEVQVEL